MSEVNEIQVLGFFIKKRDRIKGTIKDIKSDIESEKLDSEISNVTISVLEHNLKEINLIIAIMRGDPQVEIC